MPNWKPLLIGILSQICWLSSAHAEKINVAVASNFTAPMQHLVTVFEQQTTHKINVITGSSGKIYAQILNGAPFDVFLSADQIKPAALENKMLIAPNSRFTYAIGALVIWSAQADKPVSEGAWIQAGNYNKLAIANPKLAPYGVAALQYLQSFTDLSSVTKKLVFGENIAQTFQFVASGNADMGIVALSQVTSPGTSLAGSSWIIPPHLYQPIKQDAVLLVSAVDKIAAKEFIQFLRSISAHQIINSYGYTTETAETTK